jgi:hypothetical protein
MYIILAIAGWIWTAVLTVFLLFALRRRRGRVEGNPPDAEATEGRP